MGSGSGAGGGGTLNLFEFCPRCKRLGLMYGECQFDDCDYPRLSWGLAFLIMCLPLAAAIAVVVLFA